MTSRGKTNIDDDSILNIEEFFHGPWVLEEYQDALKFNEISISVKEKLDGMVTSDELGGMVLENTYPPTSDELAEAKYYFAGGSCRYMFRYDTARVVGELLNAISSVSNIFSYIQGNIGDRSDLAVNRLFSSPVGPDQIARAGIVS